MKKNSVIATKKILAAIAMAALSIGMLVGCGKSDVNNAEVPEVQETVEAEEIAIDEEETATDETEEIAEVGGDEEVPVDAPSNDFEDRVGKTIFSSYDEIIGLLENGEGYALAKVKGYDGDVLFITSYVYDDQEGHMATTECSLYTAKPDGKVTYDSMAVGGGTATPIKIDADGVVYSASHVSVDKSCYGENSIGSIALMTLASVMADELDDNGEPKSIIGFMRTSNVIIDESNFVDIASDDVDFYHQMFADYEKAQVLGFTAVE